MKFYIETFGCKVNFYESNFINEKLISYGYENVNNFLDANIIIINTCSVTHNADNKSLKFFRRVKREHPNAYLVVCGCSSQYDYNKYFGANIILGNSSKREIPELIINNFNKENLVKIYKPSTFLFDDMKITTFINKRAFIKIQDGCNNFCSYCIIPYLRGRIRSKNYTEIMEEITNLSNNDFKEIVLTGINTGAYFDSNKNLTALINDISDLDNIKRIRLSSIEVTEIGDDFLNMLKNNNKFSDHLHIPLQTGSDKILKVMNRKYSLEEYENMIKKIRNIRPNINITTDVIVGHPNETEDDFRKTLSFIETIGFGKVHVFPYSNRIGTRASKMENQNKREDIKRRSKELLSLSDELEKKYINKYIEKEVTILVEETKNNISYGYTNNYIRLKINKVLDVNTFYTFIVKEENVI